MVQELGKAGSGRRQQCRNVSERTPGHRCRRKARKRLEKTYNSKHPATWHTMAVNGIASMLRELPIDLKELSQIAKPLLEEWAAGGAMIRWAGVALYWRRQQCLANRLPRRGFTVTLSMGFACRFQRGASFAGLPRPSMIMVSAYSLGGRRRTRIVVTTRIIDRSGSSPSAMWWMPPNICLVS